MFVRMWMTRDPLTVGPEAGLAEARALMTEKKIRRLPVVHDGRVLGIIALSDLENPPPPACRVAEVMTRNPQTAGTNENIEKAAERMIRHRVGCLLVMEGESLVGIITETDLFKALLRLMGAGEGVRVTLEVAHDAWDIRTLFDSSEGTDAEILNVATLHSYAGGKGLISLRVKGLQTQEFIEGLRAQGHRVLDIS